MRLRQEWRNAPCGKYNPNVAFNQENVSGLLLENAALL